MGAAPDPPPERPQDGSSPPEGRQGPQPGSGGGPPATASGGSGHRRPTLPSLPGFLAGARPSGPAVPVEPPEPPDEFIDPISQELLIDPVLLVETGQSYERSTLEMWFKRCQEAGRPCTDPLTRQVLRHTTVVPNFSLKSLVTSWAERHRISDLSTFSKGMGKQRTMARGHSPGSPAALAAEALAELNLGPGSATHPAAAGQADGSASKPAYPALPGARLGAGDSAGPELANAATPLQRRQASVPPRPSSPQELYPSMQPGTAPPSNRRQAAEAALGALRSAAAPGGGSASASRGAAPYHAWSLMQLAGDGEGRRILWEENAIPLAIYMLGHNYSQPQQGQQQTEAEDPMEAAKPALCALLQRLAARDRDVAASISQCGGVQALVGQLTAEDPARRAAACFALYFLGWQGNAIRSAIYEALAEHAAACRLPRRALMAFWRFWEQQQQPEAAAGQAGSRPDSPSASSQAGVANHSDLAEGREAQWEPLALLLHMLAEGTASGSGTPNAASQQLLQQLDAAGTAIPAVLAHGAVASSDPAVNFAAARATHLLAQLPQNLPLLIQAILQAGQAAAAGAAEAALGESAAVAHPGYAVIGGSETPGGKAAGNAAQLLWELSYSPGSSGTYPPAVQLVQQGGHWLLPALEAALDPAQGRQAACRRIAAGLLACLLFEPPHQQPGTSAAAAADGMRRLLAQPAAAPVLQRLLALLQPDVAAAHPQAARAAALAVANMAAFRGAAPAAAAQIPEATPPGMRAKLAGFTQRLKRANPGSLGSGDYSQALGSAGSATDGASATFDREQPTEPRAALQYFGAVPLLLRLVAHCSAAAAAAEATAASAASAPVAPMLAQPTSLASPTAAQQAAAAGSAAAESAAEQRAVLVAVLQALNNLCVDPAVATRLQRWARPTVEAHQQLTSALMAAMADPSLPSASREHARQLLHTESGAPGQRHALVCTILAPPARTAAYPNP